mgnify:CR=1 FL=1
MEWRQAHIDANREVTALQAAARVIRRYAGSLRYHPVTGLSNPPGREFTEAARNLRESLGRVQEWMETFREEEALLDGRVGPRLAGEVREGHQRVHALAGLLRAALDVMEQVIARPERAALDAPYGLTSPRRTHPGTQATWVGERADGLARALAHVTLLKENSAGS